MKIISSWDLLVSLPLGLEVEKGGEHALKAISANPSLYQGLGGTTLCWTKNGYRLTKNGYRLFIFNITYELAFRS